MQLTEIERISEGLRKGEYNTNPHLAAEEKAVLAGLYSWVMGQLEMILQRKPAVWIELRKNTTSDSQAETMWKRTKDGLDEQGLRLREKAITKMMSSLSSLISLAQRDYRNQ